MPIDWFRNTQRKIGPTIPRRVQPHQTRGHWHNDIIQRRSSLVPPQWPMPRYAYITRGFTITANEHSVGMPFARLTGRSGKR